MNKVLDRKYLYLSNFFNEAIAQNRLFHSIILYGSNTYLKYAMALELTRRLNCSGGGDENCQCQNCRWIRDNKHPAVMTISKIDNKTDSSKTVISEEQVNMLLDTLVSSSDYHRVFIFCNAEIKSLSAFESEEYNEFKNAGFNVPQAENEDGIWYPSGINSACFSNVAANAMLKSIEEPFSNVTFIFLSENKDDLLQTIVSRSQSFYMPDSKHLNYDTEFLQKYFANYPDSAKNSALDFARTLYNYQTEKKAEPAYIIDCIQYYLTELLKADSKNPFLVNKIYKDIKKTEEAKKMLASYIKEQSVYENLAFYFVK